MVNKIKPLVFSYSQDRKYATLVAKMKKILLEKFGKSLFIDATKQYYIFSQYMRGNHHIDQVIHLKRNPLGVYASNKRTQKALDIVQFAQAYKRNDFVCKRLIKRNGFSYFQVRYDHLCNNQRGELTRIYNYLGLNPDDLYQKLPPIHVYGNSKVRKGQNDNIVLKPDKRWEEELTVKEIDYLQKTLKDHID